MDQSYRKITNRFITDIRISNDFLVFYDARKNPMFLVKKDAIFDDEGGHFALDGIASAKGEDNGQ